MSIIEPDKHLMVPDSGFTPIEVRVQKLERIVGTNKKLVQKSITELKEAISDMGLLISQLTFEQQSRQEQEISKK